MVEYRKIVELDRHIGKGHVEEVVRLMDEDPSLLERADARRNDGLVRHAAESGQLEMARLLIERGANIHATAMGGRTALHGAAELGHEGLTAFLLSKGAQADRKEKKGRTPLMLACDGNHLGVVRVLVEHMGGKGLEERNVDGYTALHCAVDNTCHADMVRFLLLAGADPTAVDNEGRTPRDLGVLRRTPRELELLGSRLPAFEVRTGEAPKSCR